MNKTEVLIIGSSEAQTVVTQINEHAQWKVVGAGVTEEAIEKFHQQSFRVVVLANGISEEDERKLLKLFSYPQPDIPIVQYKGSDSVVLSAKIQEALDRHKRENKPVVSFKDDALKDARLDIMVQ